MGFGPPQGGGAAGALTNSSQFVQSNATIAGTNITGTVASNGMSLSVGNYITTAMASNAGSSFVAASAAFNGTNCSGTIASNAVSVSVAAAGGVTLSMYEPFQIISTAASSFAPASWQFVQVEIPNAVAMSNIIMARSINIGVPGATSQASTGTLRYSYSDAVSVFSRVNYGANSSRISYLTSASFGLTAGLSYSSTSQSVVISWVTDTTGGTTSYNTTSADAGWSSLVGLGKARRTPIPFVTTLSAGEYFFAFQHSSTSGTTNSNVTLLSVSRYGVAQNTPLGVSIGQVSGGASAGLAGFMGIGQASAVTTNNSMAITNITFVADAVPYMMFFNGIQSN